MSDIGSALLALGVTALVTPVVVAALRRRRVLDHPNERSSHEVPTPRGGGVAPALGMVVALCATTGLDGSLRTGILVAATGFGLLGLVEDLRGVPPAPRFLLQLLVAALSLPWWLDQMTGPLAWRGLFLAGCLLWLLAYTNAFNFMDGINGISAAQVLLAGVAWWALGRAEDVPALANAGAISAGAALAFLPFNYPRARVFLGDVGSYFLGGWLAAVVIIGLRAGLPPEAVLGPVALYLADTGTTLARRIRAGEAWYLPHRRHSYQRLIQLGWSHTRTTAVAALLIAASALLGSLALTGSLVVRAVADVTLLLALIAYVTSPVLLQRGRTAVPAPNRS